MQNKITLYQNKAKTVFYLTYKEGQSPEFSTKEGGFKYLLSILTEGEADLALIESMLEKIWDLPIPTVEKGSQTLERERVLFTIINNMDRVSFIIKNVDNKLNNLGDALHISINEVMENDYSLYICKNCGTHGRIFFIPNDLESKNGIAITDDFSSKSLGKKIVEDLKSNNKIDIMLSVKIIKAIENSSLPEYSDEEKACMN